MDFAELADTEMVRGPHHRRGAVLFDDGGAAGLEANREGRAAEHWRLDARADSASNNPKICVQISWNGGSSWTTAKQTTNLTTSEATYSLGSASDTWGRTWAVGNFTNTNFRIRVIDVAGNANRDFFLDYIAVNITYQP